LILIDLNDRSSRSHCLCLVRVWWLQGTRQVHMLLVDLAAL
jgi:hypothetical protein